MIKLAWTKHVVNAYNNIKKGDKVYDNNDVLIGESDGCYARPTYKESGDVCLVKNGTFIWITGNVKKVENEWKICKE